MGWPVFGLPPWKKFSAARSRSSRSAQEDGCSSLPCRGVLSFRSGAREASGCETPRVHNVARWCGVVAARGASINSSAMAAPCQTFLTQLHVLGFREGGNTIVAYGRLEEPRGLFAVAA